MLESMADISPKKMLVLGAGAGRLAYDLHSALSTDVTVASDINPLLLLSAQRVLSGTSFSMYEFPLHPRNSDSVAVKHTIEGLEKTPDNLHLMFADAANPPFVKGAFDTVVTPWLIDIQPYELG